MSSRSIGMSQGVVYTDEASAPGKQLSFLLIAAILAATLFILPVALLMVTRLTSPLAKLGDYARKLPEQDFMEDARPTPLLAALADGQTRRRDCQPRQFTDVHG